MTVVIKEARGGATEAHPEPRPRRSHRPRRHGSRSDAVTAWLFLAPALLLFGIFIIIPTLTALSLSFFSWNFFGTPEWAGLENFAKLFGDPEAWRSLGVTFEILILGVIPTIVIGFLLAVLVNAKMPGVGLLRVLYFVPVVVSAAVSSVLWSFLYDPRQGPAAAALKVFGLTMPDVLSSQILSVPALVLMMIWMGLPIVVILYLAGLQRIPPDVQAAAALDGAGPLRILWSITWPSVASTTSIVAVLQIVNYVAASLDIPLIMTNGGPLGATRALGLYAYQQAFISQEVGYSSVLSVLQLVVIVSLVSLGRLVIKKVGA